MFEGITDRISNYFGLKFQPSEVVSTLKEADFKSAEMKLKDLGMDLDRPILGVQAHGNWNAKWWRHFASFCRQADLKGYQVLAFGEKPKKQDIVNQTWLGHTSLPTLAAIIKRCQAIVGFDSGIIHMASILDVPSVSLWGPNDPRFFLLDNEPKNTVAIRLRVPSRHCGEDHCRAGKNVGSFCPLRNGAIGGDCLDEVTTNLVWSQLKRVLRDDNTNM